MPDDPPADPDAEDAALRREVQRLRIQNRRLVDDLNDAEETTRVYRRLAYRAIQKCGDCPLCNPPTPDT